MAAIGYIPSPGFLCSADHHIDFGATLTAEQQPAKKVFLAAGGTVEATDLIGSEACINLFQMLLDSLPLFLSYNLQVRRMDSNPFVSGSSPSFFSACLAIANFAGFIPDQLAGVRFGREKPIESARSPRLSCRGRR